MFQLRKFLKYLKEDELSDKLKKKEEKKINLEKEIAKEKENNKPTYHIIKNNLTSENHEPNNFKSNIICNSKDNFLYSQFYKAGL